MGGGFPAAACGGRADVMSRLSPEGPVYQAGTLSGNPIATTAGLATLRLATDEVYAHISSAAEPIKDAVKETFTSAGLPHRIQSQGTMFSRSEDRRGGKECVSTCRSWLSPYYSNKNTNTKHSI